MFNINLGFKSIDESNWLTSQEVHRELKSMKVVTDKKTDEVTILVLKPLSQLKTIYYNGRHRITLQLQFITKLLLFDFMPIWIQLIAKLLLQYHSKMSSNCRIILAWLAGIGSNIAWLWDCNHSNNSQH